MKQYLMVNVMMTSVGYRVGYRIAYTEGSYSFKQVEPPVDTTYLTNLQRMTKYAIVVQAYNRAGAGPASDEVIAATLETCKRHVFFYLDELLVRLLYNISR